MYLVFITVSSQTPSVKELESSSRAISEIVEAIRALQAVDDDSSTANDQRENFLPLFNIKSMNYKLSIYKYKNSRYSL